MWVTAGSVFGENLLPGSQLAVLAPRPHVVEGTRTCSGPLFKGADPAYELQPRDLTTTCLQTPAQWELGFNLQNNTNIQTRHR